MSDEDKKEVIANKANYTLEEIEGKLSVISVRKKVNFNSDNEMKNNINTEDAVYTYSYMGNESSTPAWVNAVKNTQNKNNN